MNISWTAIVGIFLALWRWITPKNKWESKREAARKALKEIDNALERNTLKLVEAKKAGDLSAYCPLDIERERLLANRRACQHEYDYFAGLCDKIR